MSIYQLFISTELINHNASFCINNIHYDNFEDIPVSDMATEVDIVTITGDGSKVYINTAD